MTQKALTDEEVIDFADHHSATLGTRPGRLNPYKVGVELFRYIQDKWNRGRFGKEYDECPDLEKKRRWDKHLGLGREKVFEVRRLHNDVTFIDEYMDQEFCYTQGLFSYDYNKRANHWEISSREFREVKQKLLFSLTNFGQPIIEVVDLNHANRGELLLVHRHENIDLKLDWAQATMESLHHIWTRPVLVRTVLDEKHTILCYNGKEHTSETVSASDGLGDSPEEEDQKE
jgi:stage V sporulation protein R